MCDEEWRVGPFVHVPRFEGFDACLCFEAGQLADDDLEAVVVRRKAAGTLSVTAHGRSAHSGSAPDKGINALLALASAAQAVAGSQDPHGPQRLTAVPTVLHAGDAFNVVPGIGELVCDLRADSLDAFEGVLQALPAELGGARLEAQLVRQWPGMDAREATAPLLRRRPPRSGGRSSARAAAAPATRPTSRPRSPSPSTASARAAAARTRRTSTCWPRRCGPARRSRWPSRTLLCALDAAGSERALRRIHSRKPPHPPNYPLDCSGRLDQPNLCRATAESGGTNSHLGGIGANRRHECDVARPFSREPDS